MSLNDVLSLIDAEIARLQQARALLTDSGTSRRGKKKSASTRPIKRMRTISAAGRERIAEGQRKRWTAQKKAAK